MNWNESVEVLVVGSGCGGLTSALCLYEMGVKDVLVIEKGERFGGTSSYSGGGIWIPCSHLAQAAGAQDSLEEAREYLRNSVPGVDPALLDAYIANGPRMLKFLHERTRVRYQSLAHYPDYFSEAAGAKAGHRSLEPEPIHIDSLGAEAEYLMPTHPMITIGGRISLKQQEAHAMIGQLPGWWRLAARLLWNYLADIPWRFKTRRDRRACCGSAGVARLRLSMLDRDMPLWRNTRLLELVYDKGRVQGAIVNRDGRLVSIRARRGVVLAAGGFEKNQAMRDAYLPKPTNTQWSAGVFTNEGDALRAAMAIGARVRNLDGGWWVTTFCFPGDSIPRPAIIEKSYPGSCVVNRAGKRIANESQNYMTYMKEAFAKHSEQEPSSPAFMIFDARFRRNYIVGPLLKSGLRPDFLLPAAYRRQGYFAKAATLRELAGRIGIDADNLESTVAAMNHYAATGKDLEFGRGDTLYDRYYGDATIKPNPCLAPIVEAPFYAVRMDLGDWGTQGGMVTDSHARVLSENGEAMEGLYAVGNCALAVLPTYPGAGSTLGPAMTFAYQAAKHISGYNDGGADHDTRQNAALADSLPA